MIKTPLYDLTRSCTACELREKCKGPVPAVGPIDADVMIVGEAPGQNEDSGGEPWIGYAGQYLDALLYRIGLTRDEVLFSNTVKCRPTGNETPTPDQARFCGDRWLKKEIELYKPKIIMLLGKVATEFFLGEGETIEHRHGIPMHIRMDDIESGGGYTREVGGLARVRGEHSLMGTNSDDHLGRQAGDNGTGGEAPLLLPAYHPAAGFYDTAVMRFIQEDFLILGQLVRGEEVTQPVDDVLPAYMETGDFPTGGVIALDTETVGDQLWSVQLSTRSGEGLFYSREEWNAAG